MNSMASPSALHAGPLGCACFSWCDKAQITAFLDGLPSSVTSRDAPGRPPPIEELLCEPHEGLNYGCWFYPLLEPWPRGTGIFVNVGRILVLHSRRRASALFKLEEGSQSSFTITSSDPSHERRPLQGEERRPLHLNCSNLPPATAHCIFRGVRLEEKDDSLWALQANALGYDSVLILRGADAMPELMVSTSACVTRNAPIATCPPLPLRTGEGASKDCGCSDESSDVLNCDHGPRGAFGKQSGGRRRLQKI